MSRKIFISYRREDTAGFAISIKDRLAQTLGRSSYFLDADSIGIGADFVHSIEAALSESRVLLVLIGKRWNPSRLRDPSDIVRREIQAALKSGVHIVPLLFENVPMPRENEVPKEISPFTRRQAMEIRTSSFNDDFEKLLDKLNALLDRNIRGRLASLCSPEIALSLVPLVQILLPLIVFGAYHKSEGILLSAAALPSLAAKMIHSRDPWAAALFLFSGTVVTAIFIIVAMTALQGFLLAFTAFLGFPCCAAYCALAFLSLRDDRARPERQR